MSRSPHGLGEIVRRLGGGEQSADGSYQCRCPAHDDTNPSLSLRESKDGRILYHCHAGCSQRQVRDAMTAKGIVLGRSSVNAQEQRAQKATIEQIYDYHNEQGELIFQVVRNSGKRFAQRRPDGKGGYNWNLKGVDLVPYRLPELLQNKDDWILIAEGEKDVNALRAIGLNATCNPGGAGKWKDRFAKYFVNLNVAILPDNDPIGLKHAEKVAANVIRSAGRVRIVKLPNLPPKGDVSDWLESGGTRDELQQLIQSAQEWVPSANGCVGDWYSRALVGAKDNPLSNLANALIALRSDTVWQGVLGFDEMSEQIVKFKPVPSLPPSESKHFDRLVPWSDQDDVVAQEWLQLAGFPTIALATVQNAISQRAHECAFHPLRDYLENLEWDGIQRIQGYTSNEGDIIPPWLTEYFGCDDNDYVREVGKCFLVSAVARVFFPGCQVDHTLVLEGAQGTGKSSACRILAGDEYFSDSLPHVKTKDAADHIRGKWIIEISELAAVWRTDMEDVKAFLSRREERFRPAYGRREIRHKRQCVFIATTNQDRYLKDETGNRRFWPVRSGDIDLIALQRDRDQIWAEAVNLLKSNCPWHITDLYVQELAKAEQADRYEGDAWEDPIRECLSKCEGEAMTVSEIMDKALHIEKGKMDRSGQNRVVRILTMLGWIRGPRKGKRREWILDPSNR